MLKFIPVFLNFCYQRNILSIHGKQKTKLMSVKPRVTKNYALRSPLQALSGKRCNGKLKWKVYVSFGWLVIAINIFIMCLHGKYIVRMGLTSRRYKTLKIFILVSPDRSTNDSPFTKIEKTVSSI